MVSNEKLKTTVSVLGAVVMYFIDPPFDAVITGILSAFGLGNLVLSDRCKIRDKIEVVDKVKSRIYPPNIT